MTRFECGGVDDHLESVWGWCVEQVNKQEQSLNRVNNRMSGNKSEKND